MTLSCKYDGEPLHGIKFVVDGYGGAYDAAGDFGKVEIEIPLEINEAYRLAGEIVAAANKHHDYLMAARRTDTAVPGPFTIVKARKLTPEEVAARDAKRGTPPKSDGVPTTVAPDATVKP